MGKILKNSWALFAGFSVLITAHGFQGNLLGVRSVLESFNYANKNKKVFLKNLIIWLGIIGIVIIFANFLR